MKRFSGKVGYGKSQELPPNSGTWEDVIIEHSYFGDVTRNTRQLQDKPDGLNNNVAVSNSISIVADEFARDNFQDIVYVWWRGHPWTVTNVEVQPDTHRLILSIGEIYNGPLPQNEGM